MTELEIQEKIWEIEREYPNLHIDLHRDQFSYGDVKELCRQKDHFGLSTS